MTLELRNLIEYATARLNQMTGGDEDYQAVTRHNDKRKSETDPTKAVTTNRCLALDGSDDADMKDETNTTDKQSKPSTSKPRQNRAPKPDNVPRSEPTMLTSEIAPIFLKETEKWKQANSLIIKHDMRSVV